MIKQEEVIANRVPNFYQVEQRVRLVQQANKLKTACKRLLYEIDQSNSPHSQLTFADRQVGVHQE